MSSAPARRSSPTIVGLAVFAALAAGCGGSAPRSQAPEAPVAGALSQSDDGWLFRPAGEPSLAVPVPADVRAVIERIVAGEVTPGEAVLVLGPGPDGPQVVDWRCVGCDPIAADLRWAMHGTEPFWGLALRGSTATWSTPEHGSITLLVEPDGPGTAWRMRSADGAVELRVSVEEETCEDGMADAFWHATVVIERGDLRLHGCAQSG